MNRNDKLIPLAIQAIDEKLKNPDGTVPKEFEGYISSFGASVIQSGLIATLAFYSDGGDAKKDSTEYRRNKFLDAILMMIDRNHQTEPKLLSYVLTHVYPEFDYGNVNYNFAIHDADNIKLIELEEKILNCSIALKLALRTYKLNK